MPVQQGIGMGGLSMGSMSRDPADMTPASPEEERSYLGKIMGGAQYLGESLNKGGAAVRGILGGVTDIAQGQQPDWHGGLMNLVPFSDTMGLTDQKNVESGEDLLKKWGMLDENTSAWLRVPAGIATEIATDPLSYIGIGGLAKGAEAAGKTGLEMGAEHFPGMIDKLVDPIKSAQLAGDVAQSPTGLLKQFGSGERNLVSLHAPWWAKSLGLADENAQPGKLVNVPDVRNAIESMFGNDAASKADLWATNAWDKAFYSRYSPLEWFRGLFSSSASVDAAGNARATFGGVQQKLNDMAHAERATLLGKIENVKAAMQATEEELQEHFYSLATFSRDAGDTKQYDAFTTMMRENYGGMPSYQDFEKELQAALGFTPTTPQQTIMQAGQLSKTFHDCIDATRRAEDWMWNEINRHGAWIPELADANVEYAPRQSTLAAEEQKLESSLRGYGGKKAKEGLQSAEQRRDALRSVPNGSAAVDRFAQHPARQGFEVLPGGKYESIVDAEDRQVVLGQALGFTPAQAKKIDLPDLQRMFDNRHWQDELDVNWFGAHDGQAAATARRKAWEGLPPATRPKMVRDYGFDKEGNKLSKSYEDQVKEWITDNTGKGDSAAEKLAAAVDYYSPTATSERWLKKVPLLQADEKQRVQDWITNLNGGIWRTGMFDHSTMENTADYLKQGSKTLSAIMSLHNLLDQPGAVGAAIQDGVPLAMAWKESGLKPIGLETFVSKNPQLSQAVQAAISTGVPADKAMADVIENLKVNPVLVGAIKGYAGSTTKRVQSEILSWWDKMQSIYKTGLYSIWPQAHLRDLLSHTFNTWTDEKVPLFRGGENAHKGLFGAMLEANKYAKSPTKYTGPAGDWLKEFAKSEGLTGAEFTEILGSEGAKRWETMPRGGLLDTIKGEGLPGWIGSPGDKKWDRVKAPFQNIARSGQEVQQLQNFVNRGGYYVALRANGYDPGAAMQAVKRAGLDYCVDEETQMLTDRGWLRWSDVSPTDKALTIDPVTKSIRWSSIYKVNVFDSPGEMVRWKSTRIDALTTPQHRWMVHGSGKRGGYCRLAKASTHFATTEEITNKLAKIVVGGGVPSGAALATYSDEFVELVGWYVTEGSDEAGNRTAVTVSQSIAHNEHHVHSLRKIANHFRSTGCTANEYAPRDNGWGGIVTFYFGKGIGNRLRLAAPKKQITPGFLLSLTTSQLSLLYRTLMNGDGHVMKRGGTEVWTQKDAGRVDGFQMLCSMLGLRTNSRLYGGDCSQITKYKATIIKSRYLRDRGYITREAYSGKIWCPTTEDGTWMARRNGVTYWTGNSEMGAFDQNVMRRIAPFWGFYRKNMPYQFANMASEPGGMAATAIKQMANYSTDKSEDIYTPNFLREQMSFHIGDNNPKAQNFLRSSVVPFGDFNDVVFSGTTPMLGRTFEKFVSRANPLMLYPAELAANRQFSTGRSLDDLEDPAKSLLGIDSPALRQAEHYGPWSRGVGEVAGQLRADRPEWMNALGMTGMARVSTYDSSAWKIRDMRDAIADQLRSQPEVKSWTSFFVPKGLQSQMDPQRLQWIEDNRKLREREVRLLGQYMHDNPRET